MRSGEVWRKEGKYNGEKRRTAVRSGEERRLKASKGGERRMTAMMNVVVVIHERARQIIGCVKKQKMKNAALISRKK